MTICLTTKPKWRWKCRGFTVLELLVAVSVMTLIVYALYAMFDQTQQAMLKNATQVDVNEGGRAAMDLMMRELQVANTTRLPHYTNLYSGSICFYSKISSNTVPLLQPYNADAQAGDIRDGYRTNIMQDFTFVTRSGNRLNIISYRIVDSELGAGTLGRFETNFPAIHSNGMLFDRAFMNVAQRADQAFQPVTDGVIHMRITPFDRQGRPLRHNLYHHDPRGLKVVRLNKAGQPLPPINPGDLRTIDAVVWQSQSEGYESDVVFYEALPAYFELEMGMLEPQVVGQMESMPEQFKAGFLAKQIGKVHLFRQRIPVRQHLR